jgi:aerobic-type carbon monoxide dehydrogenase small subunit (CoxS/CutS family)
MILSNLLWNINYLLPKSNSISMEETIRFELNIKKTEMILDPNLTLLWVLRNKFGLTGTKYGCGMGFCGACTVLMEQEAVRSCMLLVSDAANKKIVTIEGLARIGLRFVKNSIIEKLTKKVLFSYWYYVKIV